MISTPAGCISSSAWKSRIWKMRPGSGNSRRAQSNNIHLHYTAEEEEKKDEIKKIF